jgi:YndJ-like protein
MLARIKPQTARTSALLGAGVWAIFLFIRTAPSYETELIDKILLLGVLVVVPLALSLVAKPNGNGEHALLYRLAVFAQPFGAAAVIASFFLEQGIGAALLASAWLVATSLIALYGLSRLALRHLLTAAEVSIDVALVYLSVGSGWFVMSRLGNQPLGFGDTIVLLTAVHFHFAGFAAPILTGLAGRMLERATRKVRRVFVLAAVAVTIGTPLVAAGITVSPVLALAGTLTISLGLALLAVLVIGRIVPVLTSLPPRLLLVVSSASSLIAMVLASLYAYSIVTRTLIIDIPHMAMSHGIINALGFSLCGLLGWAIAQSDSRP